MKKYFLRAPKYGQEKINIMSSCDLFILPTYNENYGIVVAESLSRGTPVNDNQKVHHGKY